MLTAILKKTQRTGYRGSVAVIAEEEAKAYMHRLSREIVLAVNWNRPEIVKDMLTLLPPRDQSTVHGVSHPTDLALQRAYELHRGEILDVLLEEPDQTTAK